MFDFDAGKLLIIGVIALIVIGPKELPRVLRQVGQFVGRMRRMASEFQGQFMDAMKEADLQSIRDEIDKVSRESRVDFNFDPARDVQTELTRSIEATPAAAPATLEAAPSIASPTDGFTLPSPDVTAEPLPADVPEESATLAAAGLAPTTEGTGEDEPPAEAPAPAAPARKRKILMRKRRSLRGNGPHEVWNRTGVPRIPPAGAVRQGATEP